MTLPALPSGLQTRGQWRGVGGGCVCDVWRVELDDGRAAAVKRTPYPAPVEADGLRALARAGAPVPAVLGVLEHVLVLEWVAGPPDWAGVGRALARVHATTGEAFGWSCDNRIGPLIQHNAWEADWPTFYAERRIRPHLGAPALPGSLRERLQRALEGPLQALLPSPAAPSLVHGDLWPGNIVDGRWLVDPATFYADREYELAVMELFGGVPAALLDSYLEVAPLPAGWQRRRPALQLSHMLVHVRLFGAGYAGAVAARLEALGW